MPHSRCKDRFSSNPITWTQRRVSHGGLSAPHQAFISPSDCFEPARQEVTGVATRAPLEAENDIGRGGVGDGRVGYGGEATSEKKGLDLDTWYSEKAG